MSMREICMHEGGAQLQIMRETGAGIEMLGIQGRMRSDYNRSKSSNCRERQLLEWSHKRFRSPRHCTS